MNKVTIKGKEYKLVKDILGEGNKLNFSAKNKREEKVNFSDLKGKIIISTFPDINTRICDEQTRWLSKLAMDHPNQKFLSITIDPVEVINTWCGANNIDNLDIWSDYNLEFGKTTGLLIEEINKLNRSFLLVEDGVIKDIAFNKEVSSNPAYDKVLEWLK